MDLPVTDTDEEARPGVLEADLLFHEVFCNIK